MRGGGRSPRPVRSAAPAHGGADRRAGDDGPRRARRGRAPARRDLHAAGHHVRGHRRGRPAVKDRPFPLDLVPRILPADEWDHIKRGLAQRIRALNHFVDDVYHGREIVREGIVPWRLDRQPLALRARRARHPPAGRRLLPRRGLRPRARRRRHVEGARGQRPHAVGHLLRAREPRRDDAPRARSSSSTTACARSTTTRSCCSPRCASVAPAAEGEATVVVWTPGPHELRLLRARVPRPPDGRRARRGLRPRRARRRPLHAHDARPARACTRSTGASTTTSSTRSSSAPTRCSACPGLVRAYRAGTVAIANAFGTGVADDKAIYHYVPEMIRFYLGEEPILDERHDLPADRPRAARGRARRGCDELVVKPTGESRRQGRLHRPAHAEPTSSTGLADVDPRAARALDRPGARATSRRCRPPATTARSRRATSTCGRSRSSASASASSPAA